MNCREEAQNHLKRETRGKDKDYLRTKINLKKKKYNKVLNKAVGNLSENNQK